MSDTLLYALVIYGVGCVVPTPLDQQPAAQNYPPSFVTAQVSPPFGPLHLKPGDMTELHFAATDANSDDTLKVRVFLAGTTSSDRVPLPGNPEALLNKPTPPDKTDPNLRLGSFPAGDLCRLSTRTLYAVVADRPFTDNTAMANGGFTDENHWDLSCM